MREGGREGERIENCSYISLERIAVDVRHDTIMGHGRRCCEGVSLCALRVVPVVIGYGALCRVGLCNTRKSVYYIIYTSV